jgi:ribosomal-protein-alanine N-acetyltransferase
MRTFAIPVSTPRLTLREFVASDFDAVHAYSSDPRVTRYLFFGPRDRDGTADYLHGLIESQRENPRTRFGACDLSLIERGVADLGYMLAHEHWGSGYATEISRRLLQAAFLELRAERVISTVDINNRASIHVLEKVGMRWEAVFRKHRRAKNRWWDCHLYVQPREVWEASRGAQAESRL